jgi:hypothetical protein
VGEGCATTTPVESLGAAGAAVIAAGTATVAFDTTTVAGTAVAEMAVALAAGSGSTISGVVAAPTVGAVDGKSDVVAIAAGVGVDATAVV